MDYSEDLVLCVLFSLERHNTDTFNSKIRIEYIFQIIFRTNHLFLGNVDSNQHNKLTHFWLLDCCLLYKNTNKWSLNIGQYLKQYRLKSSR